eukprot:1192329-Prorocentrum_minimum.AAC.6
MFRIWPLAASRSSTSRLALKRRKVVLTLPGSTSSARWNCASAGAYSLHPMWHMPTMRAVFAWFMASCVGSIRADAAKHWRAVSKTFC